MWEQRESNPRPSACKADALNQLSYAPFLNWDCKDRCYFLFCKFYLTFPQEFDYICGPFGRGFAKVRNGIAVRTFPISVRSSVQWGCFGFDSIRHWAVSTPGVVGLPVNLGLQTISWQQLLCTRCVVCKAHYLNPRRQGCVADEYPSRLYAGYGWNMGYHSNQLPGATPLTSAKL